jgi:hypothetical protein
MFERKLDPVRGTWLALLGVALSVAACSEDTVKEDDWYAFPPPNPVQTQGDGGNAPDDTPPGDAPPIDTPPVNPPPTGSDDDADAGFQNGGAEDAGVDAQTEEPDAEAPESKNPLDKYGLEPLPITGEPLDVPDRKWTYVEFPDTKCRDGSPAGIGIRRNAASEDLMIFLEGGGACFDNITCLANPANTALFRGEQKGGILNPDDPNNPLKDWNVVYVPYCTGDVHAGTRANVKVTELFPKEQFVGYLNMEKFLQRVVPTFPNPKRVLLTGISAGGFGASSTAVLVQRAFPNHKVMLIDDSGPPQSAEVVPPCLQKRMRELWGLDNSILKDCPSCDPDNMLQTFGKYLVETFDDRPAGLISSIHDGVIAGFFGAGNDGCKGTALLNSVPPATFEKGLLEFREIAKGSTTFGTYFLEGTQHTWLTDIFTVKFTQAEVKGVKLTQWVSDIVNGVGVSHVGP